MDRQEHLLTILGEECSELHQEICKALRFGINHQNNSSETNAHRIFKEFNDLLSMSEMVNDSVVKTSKGITYSDKGIMYRDDNLILEKKAKVEKFLLHSKECGTLDDPKDAEIKRLQRIIFHMTHHEGALEETKEQWLPIIRDFTQDA
jgi:hypothetical protein